MKRFLSITLCVMMLASLFAVNVSAAFVPIADYASTGSNDSYTQDFSDITTNADFTPAAEDASANTDNEILTINGNEQTRYGATVSPITSSKYTLSFKIRKNDALSNKTKPITRICVNRPIGDKSYYGWSVSTYMLTQNKWTEYRFTIDESKYNGTNTYSIISNAVMKEEGAASWTTMSYAGDNWHPDSAASGRADVNHVVAPNGYGLAFANGLYSDGFIDASDIDDTDGDAATNSPEEIAALKAKISCSLDDIKVQNYVVKTPTAKNTIVGVYNTYDMETTPTSFTEYDENSGKPQLSVYGTEDNGNTYMKFSIKDPESYTGTEYSQYLVHKYAATPTSDKFMLSFDLNNTVTGLPFTFSVYGNWEGNDNLFATNKISFRSCDEDENKWYSYKVIFDQNNQTWRFNPITAYRRERGTTGPWEKLQNGVHFSTADVSGGWNAGNANSVRIGFNGYTLSDEDATAEWLIDNFQGTDLVATAGNVTLSGSTLTANLTVSTDSVKATPIVAVFDGTTGLFKALGSYEVTNDGAATVVCKNYAEGDTVKLFIWDTLATGKPLLETVKTITVTQ